MNVIFLTMSPFYDLDVHNIYADLLKEFIAHGHKPYLVSPCEKNNVHKTQLIDHEEYGVLKVQVGNTSGVSLIEKGIATILMENQFIAAIKKHLKSVNFDLIIYSTPPVTFAKVIGYLKKKHKAPTYLLLKDIFPQNAVDLGMFQDRSLVHRYFHMKEKQLYDISDHIGCMSQANVDYIVRHNPELDATRIHVNPNCIYPHDIRKNKTAVQNLHIKYNIPQNKIVFMYGGNLGKPQCIPFIIECLKRISNRKDSFFIICGTGNDYPLLEQYMKSENPSNVILINGLPKNEYDTLLQLCDIGLLFLDYRFTIPNFPSRMLSYMEQSIPILACTDTATDVGIVIEEANCGWFCKSDNSKNFEDIVNMILSMPDELAIRGKNGRDYLIKNYHTANSYAIIAEKIGLK